MWDSSKKDIILCQSLEDIEFYLGLIKPGMIVATDTETDGLKRFRQVVGIGFALNEDQAFYLPWLKYNPALDMLIDYWGDDQSAVKKLVVDVLERQGVKWLGHNILFDAIALENTFGINIIERVHADTMLLAHLVHSESGPLGLKPLAALLLDSNAAKPQDDVKDAVKAVGGSTTKDNYEMFKCPTELLGTYCCWDVLYTFGLYNKFYPELEKQGLFSLWQEETMPLLPVSYELNSKGVQVDVPYFEKLRGEIKQNIEKIEQEIYDSIAKDIVDYEIQQVWDELTITHRSVAGKHLITSGLAIVVGEKKEKHLELLDEGMARRSLLEFYKNQNSVARIFNLDSGMDKAFLLYDVLELPCPKMTKSGKRATDAATLEELCIEYKDSSPIIQKLLDRASERKLLSTYVEAILDAQIDGRIYTGFNATGTTSGRYSSSKPINLQTLPRSDLRIKSGIVAGTGNVFISADFSSLEPRCFAAASNEPGLLKVYKEELDLYSQAGIDFYGVKEVSAKEGAPNFLKNVDPELRQRMKVGVLARAYGAGPTRLAHAMSITKEEAIEFCNRMDKAWPTYSKWANNIRHNIQVNGYVTNLVGRRRRAPLVHGLYKRFRVEKFDRRTVEKIYAKVKNEYPEYPGASEFYYGIKNCFDNAVNFSIQSLAASVCNAAMITFRARAKEAGLKADIVLQVHDSLTVVCKKDIAEPVAKLLQSSMEINRVTKMISVPMKAVPVICESLREDK